MRNFLNEVEIRKYVEVDGLSFSQIAKVLNKNVGSISSFCKKKNINSKFMDKIKSKSFPIEEIYLKYESGKSFDFLMKEYNTSVATLKRHLLKYKNDIKFRSMNEAKRPDLLNDRDLLIEEIKLKSLRKIAKDLKVKPYTVCCAIKRLDISLFKLDPIEDDMINEYYRDKNFTINQICELFDLSYDRVLKKIREMGLVVRKQGGVIRDSKHTLLNNKTWLEEQYNIKLRGLSSIADEIGTTVGNISHHLNKLNIKRRNKSEYLQILMNKSHGERGEINDIKYDSLIEASFLRNADFKVMKRSIEFEYCGSTCFIDFKTENGLVEVKSKEESEIPGVNRKRLVKQILVAKNNNVDVKIWNGHWYDLKIEDIDKYYCQNWKLLFKTYTECFEWLINYGFKGIEYNFNELLSCKKHLTRIKPGFELNANYQNSESLKLIKHFSQHFWNSSHNEYLPISAAWEIGNRTVLKNALKLLWDKKEINLYGLVKLINQHFKDFSLPSIFKPWVASHIYEKYLPNGGIVVDPCMGWGGRLIGCLDKNINYYGFDLNQNAVDSHDKLGKFLKGRLKEFSFKQADSSICNFPKCDLIFTSPPYDNHELYYGIDSSKTLTEPIFKNIFKHNALVILNIPKYQRQICIDIANSNGYQLIDELEMKTSSFMGREKTFEPILVFKK